MEDNSDLLEKLNNYIYDRIISHISKWNRLSRGNFYEFSSMDWLDENETMAVTALSNQDVSMLSESLNERLYSNGFTGFIDTYHKRKGVIVKIEITTL